MNCCNGSEEMHGNGPRIRIIKKGSPEAESLNFDDLSRLAEGCCGGGFTRRFKSKEEKSKDLEAYLKDLEDEAAAVREAIADLKTA